MPNCTIAKRNNDTFLILAETTSANDDKWKSYRELDLEIENIQENDLVMEVTKIKFNDSCNCFEPINVTFNGEQSDDSICSGKRFMETKVERDLEIEETKVKLELNDPHEVFRVSTSGVNIKEGGLIQLEDGRFVTLLPLQTNHAEWNEEETKLLIGLYKEKKALLESRKIKTMKKLWEEISEGMGEFNHRFTPYQVENKWKSLERAYKNVLTNKNKTGRGRKYCPFEKELAEILALRHSVNSICTLSSLDNLQNVNRKSSCSLVLQEDTGPSYSAGPSSTATSRRTATGEPVNKAQAMAVNFDGGMSSSDVELEAGPNIMGRPATPTRHKPTPALRRTPRTARANKLIVKSRSTVVELRELRKIEERKLQLLEERFAFQKQIANTRTRQIDEFLALKRQQLKHP